MNDAGAGKHFMSHSNYSLIHCIVNNIIRSAAKDAGSVAMRLRSLAAEETKTSNATGDSFPAASSEHPAADAAVGPCSDTPREIEDYDFVLIYSGESDGDTDSNKAATEKEPDVSKPESIKSVSRSAVSLAHRPTRRTIRSQDGFTHSRVLEAAA